MSKEQYVQLFASAPARFLLILAAIVGGGAGLQLVPALGGDVGKDQQQLVDCRKDLNDTRSLAERYETDAAEISTWAKGIADTLPELQRLEALGRAPQSFIYASGIGMGFDR